MSDGLPPEDFDYGDRKPDGQYERYPTIDDGDFQQAVRDTYVHDVDDCGATTSMSPDLAESVARKPTYYGKTFCGGCGDHVPTSEVVWKEDGQDWVMDDPYPNSDPCHEPLAQELKDVQTRLLMAADTADHRGDPMLARLFESWAHTLYLQRADLDDDVEPKTLMAFLDDVDGYHPPEQRGDGDV